MDDCMTAFRTSAEMYDAGYCLQQYNINSDLTYWRFRDDVVRTWGEVPTVQNKEPNIPLARYEDVKAAEWSRS